MRATRTLAAAFVAAALLLTGCQDSQPRAVEETPSSGSSPTADPTEETPAGTVIPITIDGDSVEPNGERVAAAVGEPITLQITADRSGELHVHSTPEQELPFEEGTTEVQLTIDQPGVVEVEDHDSGLVIVQLEVS